MSVAYVCHDDKDELWNQNKLCPMKYVTLDLPNDTLDAYF